MGGIQITFVPVEKPLKKDQHVFKMRLGSDNFLEILGKYTPFEVLIKTTQLILKGTKPL